MIGAVRKRADKDYFALGYRECVLILGYSNEAKQWDNDVLSQLIPN